MTSHPDMEQINTLAAPVKLLVLDVDGVMTDGALYYSGGGEETKAFYTQDGLGVKLLQKSGVAVAVITGRQSEIVANRAKELGVELVYQGRDDKLAVLAEILEKLGLDYPELAYVGDDLPDLACIKKAGLGITVPDAHFLVKENADCVTTRPGGKGAVREVCDWILMAQGNFEDAVESYH